MYDCKFPKESRSYKFCMGCKDKYVCENSTEKKETVNHTQHYNSDYQRILSTEYSKEFDELRKKMMVMSFYKYGGVKENAENGTTDFIKSLDMRYKKFLETRNTEFLADMANICMMIYMFPSAFGCYYKPTDSAESCGIDGMSMQDIRNYDKII